MVSNIYFMRISEYVRGRVILDRFIQMDKQRCIYRDF